MTELLDRIIMTRLWLLCGCYVLGPDAGKKCFSGVWTHVHMWVDISLGTAWDLLLSIQSPSWRHIEDGVRSQLIPKPGL